MQRGRRSGGTQRKARPRCGCDVHQQTEADLNEVRGDLLRLGHHVRI